MIKDEHLRYQCRDMVVVLVCDGYEHIKSDMVEYLQKFELFTRKILTSKQYMQESDYEEGKYEMKPIRDIMERNKDNKK